MSAKNLIAQLAAKHLLNRIESEYLHAKERARIELKLPEGTSLPSNRQIKKIIRQLSLEKMGEEEFETLLDNMRLLAEEIMTVIEEHDPFLLGSVLNSTIREGSDIDIHAYGNPDAILSKLENFGYEEIDLEEVENIKGIFYHLRWIEKFPVEITVYPWSERNVVPYSSITGKPMERWSLEKLRKNIPEI